MSRQPLQEKLIEDRFIEIKTDMRKGKVVITHNYSKPEYAIKTLENAINHLKTNEQ
jgi:hypothetical protein